MPNITILDGYTLNPGDLSWDVITQLGTTILHERTAPSEIIERAKNAEIVLVNKVVLTEETIAQLPNLKCICVTATGYNNVAVAAASKRKIPVCNAVGYGSQGVAQHVFALLLALTNRVEKHSQSVKNGDWAKSPDFSYSLQSIQELSEWTMGIYGFGRIGRKVAEIALAFGMKVMAHHKHPERDAIPNVQFVDLESLFANSDVVSLHAPLSDANYEIVNEKLLSKMLPHAYLINTGRGGLVKEADLVNTLKAQKIAGAALDVLQQEPPVLDHPLYQLDNCIITPHQAWASKASRKRLINITAENIQAFLDGHPQNVVNEIL